MRLFGERPEDTSDAVPPGAEVVPGHRVVSLMRRGNRIDTYDVVSEDRDCRCVIKVLRPDRAHEDQARSALIQEGTLLRDLAHPHLVRVYEVLTEPTPAFVMETLTGATLDAVLDDTLLSPRDAAHLGRQLVSALGYLHRHGWLHLDVKPSNVVVQDARAVLIDLSLAAPPGDGRTHAGTDGYLAPEQVSGRGLSEATDVFGLGVTLGEALTGDLPYGMEDTWATGTAPRPAGRRFRRRLAEAPAPLADLVTASIDPDPARRPSLDQVRTVLDPITAGEQHGSAG